MFFGIMYVVQWVVLKVISQPGISTVVLSCTFSLTGSQSADLVFVLIIFSFSFLWGPTNHLKHLCSLGRLPFTAAYFGSMLATIYVAMFVSMKTQLF